MCFFWLSGQFVCFASMLMVLTLVYGTIETNSIIFDLDDCRTHITHRCHVETGESLDRPVIFSFLVTAIDDTMHEMFYSFQSCRSVSQDQIRRIYIILRIMRAVFLSIVSITRIFSAMGSSRTSLVSWRRFRHTTLKRTSLWSRVSQRLYIMLLSITSFSKR